MWLVADLPQRRAGFKPRPNHVGFIVDSDTGPGFIRVLRFLLPFPPPAAPHSSPSIDRAGTVWQRVSDVPSALSLAAPQAKLLQSV
jgi:hypothetical protein